MQFLSSKAFLIVFISTIIAFAAGFYLGGKSVGYVLDSIGVQSESSRLKLQVKSAALLRKGEYEQLQRIYDISIQCAPDTLELYLPGVNATIASDIQAAIASAAQYKSKYGLGECEKAQ